MAIRTKSPTVSKVLDVFEKLPLEEKEYVHEIVEKQLVEARRAKIARRAQEARHNYKRGHARKGTTNALYLDLENQ